MLNGCLRRNCLGPGYAAQEELVGCRGPPRDTGSGNLGLPLLRLRGWGAHLLTGVSVHLEVLSLHPRRPEHLRSEHLLSGSSVLLEVLSFHPRRPEHLRSVHLLSGSSVRLEVMSLHAALPEHLRFGHPALYTSGMLECACSLGQST